MLLLLKPADPTLQLETGLLTNLACLGTSAKQYIPKRNVVGDYSGNTNRFNAVNIENYYWSDEEEEDEAGNGIENTITYLTHYRSNFWCLYRFRSKLRHSLDGPVFPECRIHRANQDHRRH